MLLRWALAAQWSSGRNKGTFLTSRNNFVTRQAFNIEDHSHAETVRKLVGKYGLSLAEVARRIGVSTSAVSKMLAGIDLSQLPIRYPGSTVVVSRSFLSGKRDFVKRFLRGWIEGIKTAKTDKDVTVKVMQNFSKPATGPFSTSLSKFTDPSTKEFPSRILKSWVSH